MTSSNSWLQDLGLRARPYLPGLLLSATVAAAASFLAQHYGGPVMLFALLIGMAFNFLAEEERFIVGLNFASQTLLRTGVALLGIRITFGDLHQLGTGTILAVVGLMILTIVTGFLAARFFKRKWRFALLTGGAVAICGASAALAISSVIPANERLERNTIFTVAAVTTLSTLAMIAYPILFGALDLNDLQSGFLIGATIHDVAQVVGAGYSISDAAGDTATVVKLLRVALLPFVLIVIILAMRSRSASAARPGVPLFVIGFAALLTINSFGIVPAVAVEAISEISRLLLIGAIAALGVKTNLKTIAEVGGGHTAIIVIESIVLLGAAIALFHFGLMRI